MTETILMIKRLLGSYMSMADRKKATDSVAISTGEKITLIKATTSALVGNVIFAVFEVFEVFTGSAKSINRSRNDPAQPIRWETFKHNLQGLPKL